MASFPRSQNSRRWLFSAVIATAFLLFLVFSSGFFWVLNATNHRHLSLINATLFQLGWVFWFGATFPVMGLARRFPIRRTHLGRSLVLHTGLGIAVAIMTGLFEMGVYILCRQRWGDEVLRIEPIGFLYQSPIYILVYWLVVSVTQAFDYYVKVQESELRASQLEAQLAQAQLQALRMQLQPHFLFNTHHSIVSLMLQEQTTAAIKMLTRLSDLLRHTLQQPERQVITLQEELSTLELYLGIQRERFRERLTIERAVATDVLTAGVPRFLFQPLVENALQHGIETNGTGVLRIEARRDGDQVVLCVADDGSGWPSDFSLEQASGVGLANTRARLDRMYGPNHRLEFRTGASGGAEVVVTLPFLEIEPVVAERERAVV